MPYQTAAYTALQGTKFKVVATNPKTNSKVPLGDTAGNTQFTFPQVNFQPTVQPTITVQRPTGGSDTLSLTGTICSSSPSPIHLEVSFDYFDLSCRLSKYPNFPPPLGQNGCPMGVNFFPPVLYDPNNPVLADRHQAEGVYLQSGSNNIVTYTTDAFANNPVVYQLFQNAYPGPRWPNSVIGNSNLLDPNSDGSLTSTTLFPLNISNPSLPVVFAGSSSGSPASQAAYATFMSQIVPLGLVEVDSGTPLGGVQDGYVDVSGQGPNLSGGMSVYNQDRSAISVEPAALSQFWDFDQVGTPYTPSTVAYTLNSALPVGQYLYTNYNQITSLVREVKRYETPLGFSSQMLGNFQLTNPTPGNAACPYQFAITSQNTSVTGMSQYVPFISAQVMAFLLQGQASGPQLTSIDTNVAQVMQTLPLDLRFFQDGVMIQQLLTDYGTNITKIPVLGRGN